MGLPVIYVFTHDSHRRSARTARRTSRSSTSPRCGRSRTWWCVRPADANETAAAWRSALERGDGPTALVADAPEAAGRSTAPDGRGGTARGAYVLAEAEGGSPQLVLSAPARRWLCASPRASARPRRRAGAGRVACRAGSCSRAGTRVPRGSACRRRAARVAVEAAARSAGAGGRTDGERDARRFGASAPARCCSGARVHGGASRGGAPEVARRMKVAVAADHGGFALKTFW